MAKIAKTKQDPSINSRSRAAKRATSPSINVDKSIKDAPRASDASPMLGVTQSSGITKKKKKKQMTRGQRERQEKGLARAEAVMDQMEKKVGGAKDRLRKRQSRKGDWDDINHATAEEQRKFTKAPDRGTRPELGQTTKPHEEEDTVMDSTAVEGTTDKASSDAQVISYTNDAQKVAVIEAEEFELIA